VSLVTASRSVEGRCGNISLGGMFVETAESVDYGTPVYLRFHLPALGGEAEVDGVVRWNASNGVGVQFDPLRAKHVWALNRMLERRPLARD